MKEFPEIRTDRLILGELSAKDIPQVIEYAGDKLVSDSTFNIPHPYEEKDAIYWINLAHQGFANKSHYVFGIRLKATKQFIGGVGIGINKNYDRGVLGYWIGVPFWNNGYVTEAVKAILAFGFDDLQLNKIFAIHLPDNPASGKVMLKNGMIKEGEMKDHLKKGGKYLSVIQYRLTKAEYELGGVAE